MSKVNVYFNPEGKEILVEGTSYTPTSEVEQLRERVKQLEALASYAATEMIKTTEEKNALVAQVEQLQEIGKVNAVVDFHDYYIKSGYSIYRNEHGWYPTETGKILNAWNAAIGLGINKLNELQAQLELLREAFYELVGNYDPKKDNYGNVLVQEVDFDAVIKAFNSTPAQCLAEVRARAVEDAINSAEQCDEDDTAWRWQVNEYANQLRQQAKGNGCYFDSDGSRSIFDDVDE